MIFTAINSAAYRRDSFVLLSLILVATPLWAREPAESPQERRSACDRELGVRIGNEGKDVIWVPTHDKLTTAMLAAAATTPHDYVVDLGAGDGKIPIAAAKEFGAKALGIEYDADMVRLAQCYVRAEDLTDRVEIRQADIFRTNISEATVVTVYLLPKLNMKLRPMLLALAPGTRVVSNRFKFGQWQPDRTITVEGVANQAYLWYVPARVAGTWRFESETTPGESFRVRFDQRFQKIRARLLAERHRKIGTVKLVGRDIEISLRSSKQTLRLFGRVADEDIQLSGSADGDEVRYVGRRQ